MFRLKLYTLRGKNFDDDIYEATLPTAEGDITINQGHAPLVSVAKPGIIAIKKNKSTKPHELENIAIYGGAIEVLDDNVRVLVDEAESPEDVIESEAKAALERARKLKADAKDDVSLAEAENMIDRHAVRLKLAELKKRSKQKY